MNTILSVPDGVFHALAGVWVAVTAFFGISWFKDLSARVRQLEAVTVSQEEKIHSLKTQRNHLRDRLHKHGIDEDSEGTLDEESSMS
jgi:cell division protein FtsB